METLNCLPRERTKPVRDGIFTEVKIWSKSWSYSEYLPIRQTLTWEQLTPEHRAYVLHPHFAESRFKAAESSNLPLTHHHHHHHHELVHLVSSRLLNERLIHMVLREKRTEILFSINLPYLIYHIYIQNVAFVSCAH